MKCLQRKNFVANLNLRNVCLVLTNCYSISEWPTSAEQLDPWQNSVSSKARQYCLRAMYASARDSRTAAVVSESAGNTRKWKGVTKIYISHSLSRLPLPPLYHLLPSWIELQFFNIWDLINSSNLSLSLRFSSFFWCMADANVDKMMGCLSSHHNTEAPQIMWKCLSCFSGRLHHWGPACQKQVV